jgi:hypothetical protein
LTAARTETATPSRQAPRQGSSGSPN